jgi:hypothetical protein
VNISRNEVSRCLRPSPLVPAAEIEDKAGAAGVARITRRPKVADDEERRAHDGETRHRPCPPADRGLLFQLAEVAFRHLRCS